MVAEESASGNVETSFWAYGGGFGIQTAADGEIEPDFSLSGHIAPPVISEAASAFRLVSGEIPPGAVAIIHHEVRFGSISVVDGLIALLPVLAGNADPSEIHEFRQSITECAKG